MALVSPRRKAIILTLNGGPPRVNSLAWIFWKNADSLGYDVEVRGHPLRREVARYRVSIQPGIVCRCRCRRPWRVAGRPAGVWFRRQCPEDRDRPGRCDRHRTNGERTMTTRGALCVLGPYDGRWHVSKPGRAWFRVCEYPELARLAVGAQPESYRQDTAYAAVRLGNESGPFVWAPLDTSNADVLAALTKHYPADPSDRDLRQRTVDLARALQSIGTAMAPIVVTDEAFRVLRDAIHAAEQRGRAAAA